MFSQATNDNTNIKNIYFLQLLCGEKLSLQNTHITVQHFGLSDLSFSVRTQVKKNRGGKKFIVSLRTSFVVEN